MCWATSSNLLLPTHSLHCKTFLFSQFAELAPQLKLKSIQVRRSPKSPNCTAPLLVLTMSARNLPLVPNFSIWVSPSYVVHLHTSSQLILTTRLLPTTSIPIVSSAVSLHHEVSNWWQSQKFGGGGGNYFTTSSSLSIFLSTSFPSTISRRVISLSFFSFSSPFSRNLIDLVFSQQIVITLVLLGALLAVTEGKRRGGKPKKARSGRVGSPITQSPLSPNKKDAE